MPEDEPAPAPAPEVTTEVTHIYTVSQSTIKMDKGYYFGARVNWKHEIGVAIHNKNGQGLLRMARTMFSLLAWSQSTIKMDKGYYPNINPKNKFPLQSVAIHNKNGQGLLLDDRRFTEQTTGIVAIHNKNGQGLLQRETPIVPNGAYRSQSTIKMDKGYY